MTKRDTVEFKSEQAQQLLDNELLKDAFANLESTVIKTMKGMVLDGSDESEKYACELVRKLQSAEGVKKSIQQHINNAKIVEINRQNQAI